MKTLILTLMMLTIAYLSNAQNVNIPDEFFKSALIAGGVDTDENLEISTSEAEAIKFLDVTNKNISDMTGIEAFINLDSLYCSSNKITSLNVSSSSNLAVLNCWSNHLTSLDISGCTALKELNCAFNNLTSFNVSNNVALVKMDCLGNELTGLDISNNTALIFLDCSQNQITSLDISNNTALTELHCGSTQITNLDISSNNALIYLDCTSSQLASLNVSGSTALKELYCGSTQLTSLDLSACTALEILRCDWSQLTSLNVNGCNALKELVCSGAPLTSLNISTNTALETVDLEWMTTLYDVCVWVLPFPPAGVEVNKEGSPNVNYTTDCASSIPGDYKEDGILYIYPNPADDLINIKIENLNNAMIEFYNVNGTLIFSKEIDAGFEKIDISGFPEGIYVIRLIQDSTIGFGKITFR
jgi:Leucine-rich repeat (LRR) protein